MSNGLIVVQRCSKFSRFPNTHFNCVCARETFGGGQEDHRRPGNHPNFEKKRSRSERAILGATLGLPGHSRSNSRNGISRPNLCENPILGATLGATLGIGWTPKFQPKFSERFFQNWGGSRAPEIINQCPLRPSLPA